MITIAQLTAEIDADISDLEAKVKTAKSKLKELMNATEESAKGSQSAMSRSWGSIGNVVSGAFSQMGASLTSFRGSLASLETMATTAGVSMSLAVSLPLAAAIKQGLLFDDLRNRAEIGFTNLLKSADGAKKMVEDLQKFAIQTPFEFTNLLKSSQSLLAMGDQADQVIPHLKAVGDAVASMGKDQSFADRITYALGQILATGKVTGHTLRELSFAGVNGFELMGKAAGKTTAEMKELVTKGLVDGKWAVQALTYEMEQKTPNAMGKISHTLMAYMSNIKDFATQTLGDIFKPLYDSSLVAAGKLQDFLQNVRDSFAKFTASQKNNALGALLSIGSIGPATLALAGLAKAVGILLSPMGLLAAAVGSVSYYLSQNPEVVKKFSDQASSSLPMFKDLADQVSRLALTFGKTLVDAFVTLMPVIAGAAKIFVDVLTAFNNLPEGLKTTIFYLAVGYKSFGLMVIIAKALAFVMNLELVQAIGAATKAFILLAREQGVFAALTTGVSTLVFALKVGLLTAIERIAIAWEAVRLKAIGAAAAQTVAAGAVTEGAAAGAGAGLLSRAGTAVSSVAGTALASAGLFFAATGEAGKGGDLTEAKRNFDELTKSLKSAQLNLDSWSKMTADQRLQSSIKDYGTNVFGAPMRGRDEIWKELIAKVQGAKTSIANLEKDNPALLSMGPDIIKHAADSINTPKGEASCAYFASMVMKAAGANIKQNGSTSSLRDALVAAGSVGKPGSQALPGDFLMFSGPKYGPDDDYKKTHGYGNHSAIYLGGGEMRQSSGGKITTQQFTDLAHATAYTVPQSLMTGGKSNLLGSNINPPGPMPDSSAKKAMDELLEKYKEMIAAHQKTIDLFGVESVAVKTRYEIEHSELRALSPAQKNRLIGLAEEEDRLNKQHETLEKFTKLRESYSQTSAEINRSTTLGSGATQTQSLAYEMAHLSLKGYTDAQKKAIVGDQEHILELSRLSEATQTLNKLKEAKYLNSLKDEDLKNTVNSVGGVHQWRQMTKNEQSVATGLFQSNKQIDSTRDYNHLIEQLTSSYSLFNNEVDKSAIAAAGGLDKWKDLNSTQQETIRIYANLTPALESLTSLSKDYGERASQALKPIKNESDLAQESIDKLTKRLIGADLFTTMYIVGLMGKIKTASSSIDNAKIDKILRHNDEMLSKQEEGVRKIGGAYAPEDAAAAASEQWLENNKENILAIKSIKGETEAARFQTEGMARAAKIYREQLSKNEAINSIKKWQELTTGQSRDLEIFSAKNPFEAWLITLELIDKATGKLKLPEGWDKSKLKDIFNLKENMQIMKQFSDGVVGIFGQMFSDLKDKGFRGLFESIYAGFSNLLFRMAVEYLQSQLAQLLTHALSPALGGGNAGGGSASSGDAASGLLGGIFGGVGSIFGGSSSSPASSDITDMSTIFGGAFASGGFMDSGKVSLVGERGPELVIPSSRSYVMNNRDLNKSLSGSGSSNTTIIMNVSTPDPNAFRPNVSRMITDAKRSGDEHDRRYGR